MKKNGLKRKTIYPAQWAIDVCGEQTSGVNAAVECFAQDVIEAGARLSQRWERKHWNMIADVLTGFDFTPGALSGGHLALEVSDAQKLDKIADKWGLSEPEFNTFLGDLSALSRAESFAVCAAVRRFWKYCRVVRPQVDEWWAPSWEPELTEKTGE